MMKYYKEAATGRVFAYEQDGSQDHLIAGKVQVTEQQAMDLVQPVADRRFVIVARLSEIDTQSTRAIRVSIIEQGNGKLMPAFEKNKLIALENEASALRAELAGLV